MFEKLIVLELASVLAGPAVGMFFAELGATVIKVENPASGGDVTRSWKLPAESSESDISAYFSAVNWGKRSIALNVAAPENRPLLEKLIRRADIVIVSYKPGDAEKFRLDYEMLRAINPEIIYGHITGYGKEDPRVGYDAILQGACGFVYMNGEPDGPPVKMPVALIDLLAAHQLKEGLLVALIKRLQTGEGGYVHTSLAASGIASLANQATNWLVAGHVPQRMGSEHPNIVPYGSIYRTADAKEIMLGVGSDVQFRKLCTILECPEIAQDQQYQTNPQRVKNREALNKILAEKIKKLKRDELMAKLDAERIPAGGILPMPEVFQQAAGKEQLLHSADITGLRTISFRLNNLPMPADLTPPPALNQDAEKILNELLD